VARWRDIEREAREAAAQPTGAPVPTASDLAPTPTITPARRRPSR
jgi:hypothetical protein